MAVQLCYNRGCGKEYNIKQNFEDSCSGIKIKTSPNRKKSLHSNDYRHHPGDPYFHDAYKGWSCCQVLEDTNKPNK